MSQNAQKRRILNLIIDSICVNLRNLWKNPLKPFHPQMSQNAQKNRVEEPTSI
jgi:hypothetical protein